MVTKDLLNKVRGYIDTGVKEGAKLVVDGRGFKLQGYENGNFIGGCLFDNVTPEMKIYQDEISDRCSRWRAKDYDEAVRLPSDHQYGNGVASFTRDGDTARDFINRVQVGMVGVNFAIPVPLAYHFRRLEAIRLWRSQPARAGFDPLLHQDQDRHLALAVRHQGRRRVRDPNHEVRICLSMTKVGPVPQPAPSSPECLRAAPAQVSRLAERRQRLRLNRQLGRSLDACRAERAGLRHEFRRRARRARRHRRPGGRLPGQFLHQPALVVRRKCPYHQDHDDQPLADLNFANGRFEGRSTAGTPVTLSR